MCPNCEGYVNTGKDVAELKQGDDPFDPMNTPARPGMTKEEIFDLMAEKITPEMKQMMEKLAEMTAKELGKKGGKDGDGNTDQEKGK